MTGFERLSAAMKRNWETIEELIDRLDEMGFTIESHQSDAICCTYPEEDGAGRYDICFFDETPIEIYRIGFYGIG